jgi:hypothetical protein
MTNEEFLKIVEERIQKCKAVLCKKGVEYAGGKPNRLHNFYRAAAALGQQPVTALRGMLVKHIVSVNDIIDDIEAGKVVKSSLIDEKLGDVINYYLILSVLFMKCPLVVPDNAGDAQNGFIDFRSGKTIKKNSRI